MLSMDMQIDLKKKKRFIRNDTYSHLIRAWNFCHQDPLSQNNKKQFEFDDIVHPSGIMVTCCLYCQTTTAANERLSAMTQAEMFMASLEWLQSFSRYV